MPRRFVIPFLIVVVLIATVAVAPLTPWGRGWLVDQVVAAAAGLGYRVTVGASSGNSWRHLVLDDLRVEGPGVELELGQASFGYFLPSLLVGELPLSLSLTHVRGSLAVDKLAFSGGGPAGPPVRVDVRGLELTDVSVDLGSAAYRLPELSLREVTTALEPAGLAFAATVATSDGRALLDGLIALGPPSLDLRVIGADASLARHWWPEVRDGSVQGRVTVDQQGVDAVLEVRNAGFDLAGLVFTEVAGPVRYRDATIEASLEGQALGGPVSATGTVDIASQHWQARYQGSPDPAAATAWIGTLVDGTPPALTVAGNAAVAGEASGWASVTVTGEVTFGGTVNGIAVENAAASFRQQPDRRTELVASGKAAGGDFSAALATTTDGFDLDVTGSSLSYDRGALRTEFDADLQVTARKGVLDGTFTAASVGTFEDLPFEAEIDGVVDEDGWQVFLARGQVTGLPLAGAAVLSQGRLTGQLRSDRVGLPYLTRPVTLTLAADGPLEALPLTLTVGADGPVGLAVRNLEVGTDLRGSLAATLEGTSLNLISGRLGPLTVSGAADVSARSAEVAFASDSVSLAAGPAIATASVAEGRVEFEGGALTATGLVEVASITAAGASTGPLAFTAAWNDQSGLRLDSETASLQYRPLPDANRGLLSASLWTFPANLWGREVTATGELATTLADVVGTLQGTVELRAAPGVADLEVAAGKVGLQARLEPGLEVAGVTVEQALEIAADLDLATTEATIRASATSIHVDLAGNLAERSPFRGHLITLTATSRLEVDPWTVAGQVAGAVELRPLGSLVGIDIDGELSGAMAVAAGTFSGELAGSLREPWPAQIGLTGTGPDLRAELATTVLDQQLEVAGSLFPERKLIADLGPYGSLQLTGNRIFGGGQLPTLKVWEAAVPGQAWSAEGNLRDAQITVVAGASSAVGRLDGNAWLLTLDVALPLTIQDRQATLELAGQFGADDPGGTLTGSLALAATPDSLTFSGSSQQLAVAGTVAAELIGGFLTDAVTPVGRVDVSGTIRPLEGPSFDVTGAWIAADRHLEATVRGRPGDLRLTAVADDVSVVWDGARVELSAAGFDPAPWFVELPASVQLDGRLGRDERGWQGDLVVAVAQPLAAEVRLSGSETVLTARAALHDPRLGGNLAGEVWPSLALEGSLEILDGRLPLTARIIGTVTEPELTIDLTSEQVQLGDLLAVPPIAARAILDLTSNRLELSGPDLDIDLVDGALAGEATFPIEVAGEPHRATVTLAGPLAAATVVAHVAGPLVSGRSDVEGNLARFELLIDPVVAGLAVEPVGLGDLAVSGTTDQAGRWTATVASEVRYLDFRTPVTVTATGEGLAYRGELAVAVPGQPRRADLAIASFAGKASAATIELDLADLDVAALAALWDRSLVGTAAGTLVVDTQPFAYDLVGSLEATTNGMPVDLTVSAGSDREADVGFDVLGFSGRATGVGPTGFEAAFSGRGATFSGRVDVGPELAASLAGRVLDRPATIEARYRPGAEQGALELGFDGAILSGDLRGPLTSIALDGRVSIPATIAAGADLEGELRVGFADGRVAGETELGMKEGPFAGTLTLAGTFFPDPSLAGTFEPRGPVGHGEVAVSVSATESGIHVQASQGTLVLSSDLGIDGRLQRVDLAGAGTVPVVGQPIDIRAAAMAWEPAAGFVGEATVLTTIEGATVVATIRGTSGLDVDILADGPWQSRAAGVIRLSPTPWSEPALAGSLAVVARGDVLEIPLLADAVFETEVAVAGTITEPQFEGPATLSGPVAASGRLTLDLEGAEVHLEGANLDVAGTLAAEGWNAAVDVRDYPVSQFLPWIDEATLSASGRATGDWRGNLTVVAPQVDVTSPTSSGSGQATLVLAAEGPTVTAALRIDGDLADLEGAGNLSGRVRGPVAISGSTFEASEYTLVGLLALTDVALAGEGGPLDAARLGGSVQLSGSATDPILTLSLKGQGAAGGELRGEIAPRSERAELVSTLTLDSWSTDLEIGLTPTDLRVEGRAAWQDLIVDLATSAAGVQLAGVGRLEGWTAAFDRTNLTVEAQGPLGKLIPATEGSISLDVAIDPLRPAQPSLTGLLEDLAFGGIPIGDLTIDAPNASREVTLEGRGVRARLRPRDGLLWTLALDDVDLSEQISVTATGEGQGRRGKLRAVVGGTVLGQAFTLPTDVDIGEGFQFRSQAELLEGTATLTASLDVETGWSGSVQAAGFEMGQATLAFSGNLSGSPTRPNVALRTELTGPLEARGEAQLSLTEVRLEQRLQFPFSTDVIHLAGSAWPSLDVVVTRPGSNSRLELATPASLGEQAIAGSGNLSLALGPAQLTVRASDAGFRLETNFEQAFGVPGLAFVSVLPSASATSLVTRLWQQGLSFEGVERTSGTVEATLNPPRLGVRDLRFTGAGVDLEVSGSVVPGQSSHLEGRASIDPSWEPAGAILGGRRFPFVIDGVDNTWFLRSDTGQGTVFAEWRPESSDVRLRTELAIGDGSLAANLSLVAGTLHGDLSLDGIPVPAVLGLPEAQLGGRIEATGDGLEGALDLRGGRSTMQIQGTWMFGPAQGGMPTLSLRNLDADVRLGTIELAGLPALQRRTRGVGGQLSGVLQLQQARVVGRVVAPELVVSGTSLPAEVEFNGPLGAVDVRANLGGSLMSGTVRADRILGVIRLERFPFDAVAAALTGETDVSAEVTGAVRFDVPFGRLRDSEVRLATELVRLERGGVVTTGNATLDYYQGRLVLDRAVFVGAGSWEASGQIEAGAIAFSLTADDADYSPLLGLIPSLAALDAGARGNLQLVASGEVGNPLVEASSDSLEITVAGSHYRLEQAHARLAGSRLDVETDLIGDTPFAGRLAVEARGTVGLIGEGALLAQIRFAGDATVPLLGEVTGIAGVVEIGPNPASMVIEGRSGGPFRLQGTLSPLDLTLAGENLTLRIPSLLLASAVADATLRLQREDTFRVSGQVAADSARFQLGIREPRAGAGNGNQVLFERIVFDAITIEAPQQITFAENFGSAEARADLVLGGTLAAPELTGEATTVRGTLRFSGRDFAVQEAVASFDPTRGTFPRIELTATTSFEKNRVVASGAGVRFVEPRNSSRIDVTLRFSGDVEPGVGGRGYTLDFDPALSSNGLIVVDAEASLTTGARALTESELLSLVTLGRLDVSTAVATAVAQSAIDTAVDLLILNDLQTAIGEALGVDVVEIRTTAFSNLLEGSGGDLFGISLRLGGYLSEEVFASYRIGTFDDEGGPFALTNEVNFLYELGPLEIDVAGRFNFEANELLTPLPGVSAAVRYRFSPGFGLEAGVDFESNRSQVRFGASWRW